MSPHGNRRFITVAIWLHYFCADSFFNLATQVKDHAGRFYKYANKPLGMMHWLLHAEDPVPPDATVALIDPDMFFLRPLWHDSFDAPSKYFASGGARKTPMPPAVSHRP